MATPERTCVGCRRRRSQAELVRFAVQSGSVVPAAVRATGRSAYLCAELECLDSAERRRAFARAFRGPVTIDPAVRLEVTRRAAMLCGRAGRGEREPAVATDERR